MLTNYSNIEQGDILVTELLYSDYSGSKTRPVLVISNTQYNLHSGNVVVLSISSTQPGSKYDVVLKTSDLQEGKLKCESKILADYPAAISKKVITAKVGRVLQGKLTEVKEKIRGLYEL